MPKRVAVLGAGLSGLYAAKAARDSGFDVTVYGIYKNFNTLSDLWVSWIPEDIAKTVPSTRIELIPLGSERKYLKLKWGRVPGRAESFVSDFPEGEKTVIGYDPQRVYAALLPETVKYGFGAFTAAEIQKLTKSYDFVFQTFAAEESYARQNPLLPYTLGVIYKDPESVSNRVRYNGSDIGYVSARFDLWGNSYFEFPMNLPLSEIVRVLPEYFLGRLKLFSLLGLNQFTRVYQPPSSTPRNLYFVGKWAEWNPYRRFDQVYEMVTGILHE